jgi:hypothetical protein
MITQRIIVPKWSTRCDVVDWSQDETGPQCPPDIRVNTQQSNISWRAPAAVNPFIFPVRAYVCASSFLRPAYPNQSANIPYPYRKKCNQTEEITTLTGKIHSLTGAKKNPDHENPHPYR